MKRSRSIVLTSLMAGAGVSISACDDQSPTRWNDTAQAPPAAQYRTLQDCKNSGEDAATCEKAYKEAEAAAPKFGDQKTCEERYGVNQCVPRSQAGGGSFFGPLLTGFLIGRALDGFGGGGRGAPIFRDRNGGYVGGFGGGYGGGYNRGYGSPQIGGGGRYDSPAAYAPSRMQSRSSVISRGGFGGGGGRGFGG